MEMETTPLKFNLCEKCEILILRSRHKLVSSQILREWHISLSFCKPGNILIRNPIKLCLIKSLDQLRIGQIAESRSFEICITLLLIVRFG